MIDLKKYAYDNYNANPTIPLIPNRDKYAFICPVLTDMHLLFTEPTNRTNYITRSLSLLYNLIDFFDTNGIKTFIQAGDLFDSDPEIVNIRLQNHYEHCIYQLCNNRKAYIVKGNHEETYRQNNLFYAYTDISSELVQKQVINADLMLPVKPYFKAVEKLSFNFPTARPVNIHFMHFNKNKQYQVNDTDAINIAIFHDDIITIESEQKLYHHKIGHGIRVDNTSIMENIDIAIGGHIHMPMLPFRLNNLRNTLMIFPGGLCQRTRAEVHTYVDIPCICITEDGQVVVEYARMMLGEIGESILESVDKKQLKQREARKAVKRHMKATKSAINMEEFLESVPSQVRYVIESADTEIVPKSVQKYYSQSF